MDALILARLQFAMTVGFHFLFPPLTFGLALLVFILETLHYRKSNDHFRVLSAFFVKILALVFVVGVATGITMEFSFGTNWATYSKIVGDIFGAPLAAEAVFSFFLESTFMAVLVFGRSRVSKRTYWLSTLLVLLGTHLSGLWILIANSWMQTPAGFEIRDGVARLTDFLAATFNPSVLPRFLHTTFAGWLTGSLFAAAICGWYLLKGRHAEHARTGLKISMSIVALSSVLQFAAGHMQAISVARHQPAKMAAFEALWETRSCAPLALFGYPDSSAPGGVKSFGIPCMLSMLIHLSPHKEVKGLGEFMSREDFDALLAGKTAAGQVVFDPPGPDVRPPVFASYFSYHVMIALGGFFIAFAMAWLYLYWRGMLERSRWFLASLVPAGILAHVAVQTGWIAAEVGRQPWVVYRILPTSSAASVTVGTGEILFSLIGFGLLYLLIFMIFLKILFTLVRKGPVELAEKQGY